MRRRPRQPQVEASVFSNSAWISASSSGNTKPAPGVPLAELGRVGDRARAGVGVVGRLAVGDVERVGRLARVEARDRRLRPPVPRHRCRRGHVDRVVRVERADLPALRVQQPLAERVQVRLELRLDAVDQALHRPGLGLRGGARTAVGLVGRVRRRPLVVVAPVLGEVAVRIDAVADGDLPVAVVVAQVLAPQPLVVERVLVAVGVRGDHEPQLGVLEQSLDLLVVRPPAVDEVVQQAAVDLEADPLARVLVRRVQDRRTRSVGYLAGALRDLQRDQLATLMRPPEHLELDELRVVARDVDRARRGCRPGSSQERQTLKPPAAWRARLLGDRLALLVALQPDLDAGRGELRALARGSGRRRLVIPDRVCRTPASSTPPAASAILSALPSSVYISSCSAPWPAAAGAIARAIATTASPSTALRLDHIEHRPSLRDG